MFSHCITLLWYQSSKLSQGASSDSRRLGQSSWCAESTSSRAAFVEKRCPEKPPQIISTNQDIRCFLLQPQAPSISSTTMLILILMTNSFPRVNFFGAKVAPSLRPWCVTEYKGLPAWRTWTPPCPSSQPARLHSLTRALFQISTRPQLWVQAFQPLTLRAHEPSRGLPRHPPGQVGFLLISLYNASPHLPQVPQSKWPGEATRAHLWAFKTPDIELPSRQVFDFQATKPSSARFLRLKPTDLQASEHSIQWLLANKVPVQCETLMKNISQK